MHWKDPKKDGEIEKREKKFQLLCSVMMPVLLFQWDVTCSNLDSRGIDSLG